MLPSGSNGLNAGTSTQNLTLQGASTILTDSANGFTNSLAFATPSSANQTLTLPDESGIVCVDNDANCVFQPTGNYVQLQQGSPTIQPGNVGVQGIFVEAWPGGSSIVDGTQFVDNPGDPTVFTNTLYSGTLTASQLVGSGGQLSITASNGQGLALQSNSSLTFDRSSNTGDTKLQFASPTLTSQVITVPNVTGEMAIAQTQLPIKHQSGVLNVDEVDAGLANSEQIIVPINGTVTHEGSLSIGVSGDLIRGFLSSTASEGSQSLSTPGCNSFDISVPGANMGDTVVASVNQALPGTWVMYGNVSSADTVTVKACAFDTSTSIPAATYRVDVWQH